MIRDAQAHVLIVTVTLARMRQHRPLSAHERAIVERLLSVDFPDVEYFRRQVPTLTVRHRCPCGCGTIELSVDPGVPRARSKAWDGPTGPIVESDSRHWLLLFQADGLLTELEHVADGGPDLSVIDPAAIEPEAQVDDDWFT